MQENYLIIYSKNFEFSIISALYHWIENPCYPAQFQQIILALTY